MSLDNNSKPTTMQEWIDKYHTAPKYLETTPKWPDCATYWKMEAGSTHRVRLFSKEIIGVFPLSGFRIVMQTSDLQATYRELLTKLKAMYSAVRNSDLVIERDFSNDQYAVAWIKAKKQFFRVRLSDDDNGSNAHQLVFTLDSGQRTVVRKDDLFPICEEFLDVRPMVTTVELEGLIPFNCSKQLGEIMTEFDWNGGLLDFLVTKVSKKRPCGTLRVPGGGATINSRLLKLLYADMKAPQLPHSGHSLLDGVIVHAEDDGNVFLQLNLPSTRALRHYCDQAKSMYDGYDCLELEKRKLKVPTEARGKILLLVDEGKVLRVVVEDDICGGWLESELQMTQEIKLRAIDTGKTLYAKLDSLFLASQMFYLLDLVPPQCVRVKLAGISKLNSDKFMSTYMGQGPPKTIIIKIVQSARENHPAEVLLYQSRISRNIQPPLETFVNINEEAIRLGIGNATSDGPRKSHAVIHSPSQIQHIDMRDVSAWITDENTKQLKPGDGIVFRVAKINDYGAFAIQPLNGNAVATTISRKIREAIERPWWKPHLLKEREKAFVKGWFYPYYSEEKVLFLRARLIKNLRNNKTKILLVDYAEYAEVDRDRLLPAMPFSVCGIGPQAAIVQGFDVSQLESKNPRNIPQLENTTYHGTLRAVHFDQCGLTIFTFSSIEVYAGFSSIEIITAEKLRKEMKLT